MGSMWDSTNTTGKQQAKVWLNLFNIFLSWKPGSRYKSNPHLSYSKNRIPIRMSKIIEPLAFAMWPIKLFRKS